MHLVTFLRKPAGIPSWAPSNIQDYTVFSWQEALDNMLSAKGFKLPLGSREPIRLKAQFIISIYLIRG